MSMVSPDFPGLRRAGAALGLLVLCAAGLPASPLDEAIPRISAGRYVEAQAELGPYVKAHPEDLSARYWLGRALLGAGQVGGPAARA